MKCNKCGTDNPQGKNVCIKCGNFLYANRPNNRQPMTPEQKKARRKSIAKGITRSCLFSILIMAGLLVVLVLLSLLLAKIIFSGESTEITEAAGVIRTHLYYKDLIPLVQNVFQI